MRESPSCGHKSSSPMSKSNPKWTIKSGLFVSSKPGDRFSVPRRVQGSGDSVRIDDGDKAAKGVSCFLHAEAQLTGSLVGHPQPLCGPKRFEPRKLAGNVYLGSGPSKTRDGKPKASLIKTRSRNPRTGRVQEAIPPGRYQYGVYFTGTRFTLA